MCHQLQYNLLPEYHEKNFSNLLRVASKYGCFQGKKKKNDQAKTLQDKAFITVLKFISIHNINSHFMSGFFFLLLLICLC